MAHGRLPGTTGSVREVRARQTRLVEADIEHRRWQTISERMGALLKGFTVLAGVAVAIAAALFVWSASRASGVVVEPFDTPPDLAARGLTGPVLAAQTLDKLKAMQAQTVSMRAASTYVSNWGDDIRVEIPHTGVSLGELRRYLREWLGSETLLSGEVFRTATGQLAVTMRTGTGAGVRVEGPDTELDGLLQRDAEAIYAATQPYRYAIWLQLKGRDAESAAVLTRLTGSANIDDRLWAYNGLGSIAPGLQGKLRAFNAALRIRADFAPALLNLAIVQGAYGHDEAAFQAYRKVLSGGARMRRELEPGRAENTLTLSRSSLAALVGDYAGAAAQDRLALSQASAPGNAALTPLVLAQDLIAAHDVSGARKALDDAGIGDAAALQARLQEVGPDLDPRPLADAALGRWDAARDEGLVALAAASASAAQDPQAPDPTIAVRSALAFAQARSGRAADAAASIAVTPVDCYGCLRARARVAALAGDARGADRWFAQAVRMAPSLPMAHGEWAQVLLERGDLAGALAQVSLAQAAGPKWADPCKTLGDIRLRQGRTSQAAQGYREALRRAPRWGAAEVALAQTLTAQGDLAGAKKAWRSAAGMDLTAEERALTIRALGAVRPV